MRYGRQAEREGAAAVSIAAIPRVSFFRVNCTLVCDGNRASSKRLARRCSCSAKQHLLTSTGTVRERRQAEP